jgi:hypothetical protein
MQLWTTDIENLLEAIRNNSALMSDYHKKRYEYLKGYLKWFKLPSLVLNAMNVFFSSGFKDHTNGALLHII